MSFFERVEKLQAEGYFPEAIGELKKFLEGRPEELQDRVRALRMLVSSCMTVSKHADSHRFAKDLLDECDIDLNTIRFTLVPSVLICICSLFSLALARRVARGFARPDLKRDIEFTTLHSILLGHYWQNIDDCARICLVMTSRAKSQRELFSAIGFLAYSNIYKGRTFFFTGVLRRIYGLCKKYQIEDLKLTFSFHLAISFQMAANHKAALKKYDDIYKDTSQASRFYQQLGRGTQINMTISECGPLVASQKISDCYSSSFSLSEARNHIQVYGGRAAILALSGRQSEARWHIAQAEKVVALTGNPLDILIGNRLFAIAMLYLEDWNNFESHLRKIESSYESYGRPKWFSDERFRLLISKSLIEKRTTTAAKYAGLYLIQTITSFEVNRVWKCLKILFRSFLFNDANYWSSRETEQYFRSSHYRSDALRSGSSGEVEISSVVSALSSTICRPGKKRAGIDGELIEAIQKVFRPSEVFENYSFDEMLNSIRAQYRVSDSTIFDTQSDSFRVYCEEAGFILGQRVPDTPDRGITKVVGIRVQDYSVDQIDVIESLFRALVHYDSFSRSFYYYEKLSNEKQRQSELDQITRKFAHDIRSPIGTIDLILKDIRGISDEERSILASANQRIREVSSNLLKSQKSSVSNFQIPVLLILKQIVSEKSLEFSRMKNIAFELKSDSHSLGIVGGPEAGELKSILSNLIQNSIDAILAKESIDSEFIRVFLVDEENKYFSIRVEDSGIGMSEEVKAQLGTPGFTYGKNNGNGIGFSTATKAIRNVGGVLSVESELEIGTKVSMTFKKRTPSNEIVGSIDLRGAELVIVVDDDVNVHQYWMKRFESLNPVFPVFYHTDVNDFELTWNALSEERRARTIVLSDYYLSDDGLNGVDLLQRSKIEKRCFLVTGIVEEALMGVRRVERDIPIVPKLLLDEVLVIVDEEKSDSQKKNVLVEVAS